LERSWRRGAAVLRSAEFRTTLLAASFDAFGLEARQRAAVHGVRLRALVDAAGVPADAPSAAAVRLARWLIEATAVPRAVQEDRAAARVQAVARGRAARAEVRTMRAAGT
jgi:hypothetical protein